MKNFTSIILWQMKNCDGLPQNIVDNLSVGDMISISGYIYTGRGSIA